MTFLDKLDTLMSEKGINKSVLSKESGIPYTTIDGIYKKGYENIKLSTIKKISKYFNVSIDYLMEETSQKTSSDRNYTEFSFNEREKTHIKKYRTLDEYGKQAIDGLLETEYTRCTEQVKEEEPPTITIKHSFHKVSAGHGFDLNNEDDWEDIEVPDTPEARRADFSLTISGDSMEPIYSDGDIVLVKSQPSVDIGETGIFVVNGSGYIKQNRGDRLMSLNPEYDDITFCDGDTVSCAGKVIGTV